MSFLRYQKVVILGTLGMPHHSHQKQQNQLEGNFYVYLPEKISFWSLTSFLRCYNLNHLVVGLAKTLLAHKFTTRIFVDKGFALKYKCFSI